MQGTTDKPGCGLLIAGTASDVGKSVLTAGICRWLYRNGVRVAPFKAQNMSNNSVVVPDAIEHGRHTGGEIGRAQALQAWACGLQPSVRFNPVLLKPDSDNTSQVVALGRPIGQISSANFRTLHKQVRDIAWDTLEALRSEFDVVVCEGAGSPAEINLRRNDFVNMGLARKMGWPVIVVGDIDRGGVFAALYGTLALLSPPDQKLIAGFVINKFRGDMGLLKPGLSKLQKLTGKTVYGVLPWQLNLWLDSEDSLPYGPMQGQLAAPLGNQWLRIAVIRLPHISNATDFDALALEPGVQVRFTIDPADIASADIAIVPGTKATVADLAWLRRLGIDSALRTRVEMKRPTMGICGGFQMLAERIQDDVESGAGGVPGLALLPVRIRFAQRKITAPAHGSAFGDVPVAGYEIHYGAVEESGRPFEPFIVRHDGGGEGIRHGTVYGTHWHGIFECDDFRRAFLTETARLAGRHDFIVSPKTTFAEERERMLDTLGDLVEQYLDTNKLWGLIQRAY